MQGLRELGYIERQNIAIEYRNANGKTQLLSDLAAELIRDEVSVIVANGPNAIKAAMKVTQAIPIIMVGAGDPVVRGLVKGLSVPGGNVTGLSSSGRGTYGKQLELLKDTFPSLARVAILNPRTTKVFLKEYQYAAKALGIEIQSIDVYRSEQLDNGFARIKEMHPDAFITMREVLTVHHAKQIVEFALQNRLPSMYENTHFVEEGGLMSYGVNDTVSWHRAAVFVDKVLKGANPATLPIEPPQLEFAINLRTANKLSVKIPPEILLEANEVIK